MKFLKIFVEVGNIETDTSIAKQYDFSLVNEAQDQYFEKCAFTGALSQ